MNTTIDILYVMTNMLDEEGPFREELNFVNSILDCCHDAIIVINKNSKIRLWNSTAERLFEFSKEEAIGSNIDIIMGEKYRNRHHKAIEEYLISGNKHMIGTTRNAPALTKTGKKIQIELSISETDDKKFFVGIAREKDSNRVMNIDE